MELRRKSRVFFGLLLTLTIFAYFALYSTNRKTKHFSRREKSITGNSSKITADLIKPDSPAIVDVATAWDHMDLRSLLCVTIDEPSSPVPKLNESKRENGSFAHYICPGAEHPKSSTGMIDWIKTVEHKAFSHIWRAAEMYPSLLLLDVGANIGVVSIPFANAYPDARVIAVEPVWPNVQLLTKSVLLNRLQDRFLILNNAVSDQAYKTVRMLSYNGLLTWSRIDAPDVVKPLAYTDKTLDKVENTVKTVTFEELLPLAKEMLVEQCVVKIDVEGAECLVVHKMDRFLREISVPLILVETDKIPSADANCVKGAFALFGKHKYVAYNGDADDYQPLDLGSYKTWRHVNTLWMKKGTDYFDFVARH